eukprot:TRINITY_DN11070_c0_g1_i1.p1 TRINITY_DN11070_c0_g1~~TRINITY_DN11070_c0_g1_i1.p1  ORF type:complete len:397 (+),score=130.17 TRINITY_DN11070_c0_g1_i1:106-1296(+)
MVAPPQPRLNEFSAFGTTYDRQYQLKGRQVQSHPAPVPETRHPWKHTLQGAKRMEDNPADRQRVNMFRQTNPQRMTPDMMKQLAVMTIRKKVIRPSGGGFTSSVPLFKEDDGECRGRPAGLAATRKPTETRPDQFAVPQNMFMYSRAAASGALTNNRTTDIIGASGPDGIDCRFEKATPKPKQKPVHFREEKNKYQIGGANIIAGEGAPAARFSRLGMQKLKRSDPIRHDVELGINEGLSMNTVAYERARPNTDKLVSEAVRSARRNRHSKIVHTAFSRNAGVGFDPDYVEPVLNPTQYSKPAVRHPISRRLETEGQQRGTISHSQHIAQHKYRTTPALPADEHFVKGPPHCRDGTSTATANQAPPAFDFPSPSATFADKLRSTVRSSARDDEFDF